MKIKCPFCKNIYDPEACDNTCPACSKRLMVAVFKKKPEGNKPSAGMATTFKPTPMPGPVPPPPPPLAPAPVPPIASPVTEFVTPKAPVIMPVIKAPPPTVTQTQRVSEPEATPEPEPAPKVIKVVMPPPPMPVAPPPPVPVPAPHVEKTPAHPGHPKSGLDLVISLQQGTGADWDAVIRVPVQVFKLANLIPARAREAIESEGIDFEELRKAVEHAGQVGPLLDIQTQTQRVHIAIEAHG